MTRVLMGLFAVAAGVVGMEAQVLYDPATRTLPEAQGWYFLALPGPAVSVIADDRARFDTTASNGVRAGYSQIAPVALERATGFRLRFDLRIEAEEHVSQNRAGISLIVLAADRRGIELGFWTNRIWAQADLPLFNQAEGANFDTTLAAVKYDLQFNGDTYTLSAGGGAILSGPLRDYTAFTGLFDPYETPNFLFLGDDTTSARGAFQLGRVELISSVIRPRLAIRALGRGAVELSWPVTTPAWLLEGSVNLTGAEWQSVPDPVPAVEGTNRVTVTVESPARYFRLRR